MCLLICFSLSAFTHNIEKRFYQYYLVYTFGFWMQKNVNLYALVLFPQQTNPLSANFFIYCMFFFLGIRKLDTELNA